MDKAVISFRKRRAARLRKRGWHSDANTWYVYWVLSNEFGVDTSKMEPPEAWEKFNELKKQGKSEVKNIGSESVKVGYGKDTKSFIDGYIKKHPEIEKEAKKYSGYLQRIKDFEKDNPNAEYGTYDMATGKTKNTTGYCVTFHQNKGADDPFGRYDDDMYSKMIAITMRELGCDSVNLGYYGNPEISFEVQDRKAALKFMREHNQDSVYDSKAEACIYNKYFDEEENPIRGWTVGGD